MAKFLVPITRDVTETTLVDVEADTPEQARDKALEEVRDCPQDFSFVADDGNYPSDPYFAGNDDLEAIEIVE